MTAASPRGWWCAALLGTVACSGRPALPDPSALTVELNRQFTASAVAWNRGDFDAFMDSYAADSLTTFVSGGHVNRGVEWIRQHYAASFAPGAARDSLRFEEFAVRPLAPTVALVTARYVLYRNGQTTSSGPFTLVMEQRGDGWRIVHDHTSSD